MKIKTYHENMDNFFTYGYDKLFGVDINKYVYGDYAGDNVYDLVSIRPIATITIDNDKTKKVLVKKNNNISD